MIKKIVFIITFCLIATLGFSQVAEIKIAIYHLYSSQIPNILEQVEKFEKMMAMVEKGQIITIEL